ncbi:unnamed protein product, partial [Phaeothamnion confervicola]
QKELPPLLGPPDTSWHIRNPLAQREYSQIGCNAFFEARPAIVHFGGFTTGETCTVRVEIVNVSATSQRLHLLPPATPAFRIRCRKRGAVAPGSSETVFVDFFPQDYRYHYDSLRIHTGGCGGGRSTDGSQINGG